MTLLERRDAKRVEVRLALFSQVRADLRCVLTILIPGQKVHLFGSITQRGRFHSASDIDLALELEPECISEFALAAEIEERMGRPVDLVLLNRSRLRERILREGEEWTL